VIYFIKDTVTQEIKTGCSGDPEKRLSELQTGNPHKLILLGAIRGNAAGEAQLHVRFARYRMEGEWFKGDIIEDVLHILAEARRPKDHPDLTIQDLSLALKMTRNTVTGLLAFGLLFRRTNGMPPYTYRVR
jgi:hypothetical protein